MPKQTAQPKSSVLTKRMCRKIKKRILHDYKIIIRDIIIEINRLSKEMTDYIKTINGFENFIIESFLYIKDRDNLISSRIFNIHRNRIFSICSMLNMIPTWTELLYENNHKEEGKRNNIVLRDTIDDTISNITDINKVIERDISKFQKDIPEFIQNINIKLVIINTQREKLETFYNSIVHEYEQLKHVKINILYNHMKKVHI
jgi:hypothetical protein